MAGPPLHPTSSAGNSSLLDGLGGEFGVSGAAADAQSRESLWSSMLHYRQLLRHNWWIIVATLSIALSVASWYIFEIPPKYQSQGRIMVSGKVSLPDGAIYSEDLSNFFGTQIELMQSQLVRERARARVQALHPEINPVEAKLDVAQQPHASIFGLTVTSDDPAYSQAYLDAIMEEYIDSKKQMRSQTSETTVSAITDELKGLEKTLSVEDDAILAFKRKNNIGYLEEEGNAAGTYLAGLEHKLASLKTEYDLLTRLSTDQNVTRRQEEDTGTGGGAGSQAVTAQFGAAAEYVKARQQIELLKAQLADYARDLRPKHPFIVELNNQIALQERLISTYGEQSKEQLAGEKDSIRIQIENMEAQIKEWQVKALDLSERLAEYDKLKGNSDRSKALYDRLLTSLQSVDVNKNINQDLVSVLQKASSSYPVKVGMGTVLGAGAAAGLLLGIGIIFLLDKLSDRVKTTNDVQSHFAERIIGSISAEKGEMDLLIQRDPRHLFLESFANLRSAFMFLPHKKARPKTIIITSAIPNEGKTTVACNFAITLANGGAKVLLVDADLRRGAAVDKFGIKEVWNGFSEVLSDEVSAEEAIVSTGYPSLDLLPRGRALSQCGRYFIGPTMDRFLQSIVTRYDFVIFDTCPILVADDTTSFAPKIDATLFVIRIGLSSIRGSRRAMQFLYDRQVNLLGVILNGIDSSSSAEYGYYQYRGYYDQEAEEMAQEKRLPVDQGS